jgi:hypothetical protein
MSDLPDWDDLCEDVDELLWYCESDYFREKWRLPEKAERIKAYVRGSKSRDEMDMEAAVRAAEEHDYDERWEVILAHAFDAAFGVDNE